MRQVADYDLYLYTLNTGAFYAHHKDMAVNHDPLSMWEDHVRHSAVPRYCKEIEPVRANGFTIRTVASWLQDYYKIHVTE